MKPQQQLRRYLVGLQEDINDLCKRKEVDSVILFNETDLKWISKHPQICEDVIKNLYPHFFCGDIHNEDDEEVEMTTFLEGGWTNIDLFPMCPFTELIDVDTHFTRFVNDTCNVPFTLGKYDDGKMCSKCFYGKRHGKCYEKGSDFQKIWKIIRSDNKDFEDFPRGLVHCQKIMYGSSEFKIQFRPKVSGSRISRDEMIEKIRDLCKKNGFVWKKEIVYLYDDEDK